MLAERHRLVATVRAGTASTALLAVLAICSTAFAVPFSLVDGGARLGHVAILFLGSVLICFPSLQVFGSYLGVRLSLAQNLALSLVIPSAAALFTLGFFPIYWFLDATMPADAAVTGTSIRVALLVCSMLLALSHCNRCLFVDAALRALRTRWPLWLGWQVLLLFITYRMATTLGMFG
ncbi:MAG: hypothetical protein KDC98_19290 [Planctomycetes bacterium]|nr:hypothetical protein [Planctomycetota bacterium]